MMISENSDDSQVISEADVSIGNGPNYSKNMKSNQPYRRENKKLKKQFREDDSTLSNCLYFCSEKREDQETMMGGSL